MTFQWQHQDFEEAALGVLREALGIDEALLRRLVSLGVTDLDAAKDFFRPQLDQLHDPFELLGMEKAVPRLLKAIESEELILIYGDYDADGVCGVALLFRFLSRLCKRKPLYYAPDRIHEGYGLTSQGIAYGQTNGATLMIVVDLGSNQRSYIEEALEAGMETIICDHHPINHIEAAAMPYALINPMQPGCTYPNKYLSGCAVAFQLARAIAQRKNIPDAKVMHLIDLVAISLATDILPLVGENRIMAGLGIQQLSVTEHVGMSALLHKLSKQKPYSISDIVYGLGPLINAPGRMSRATEAVKMLTCTDPKEAQILAQRLSSLNVQRRHFDEKQSRQAQTLVKEDDLEPKTPLVLYKEDWSAGVIGITAGRLSDQLHRPVIVFARHTDRQYIGSARSIVGIDLAEALSGCAHLVDEWGGHAYAAGLKIRANKLEEFRAAFTEKVQAIWPETNGSPVLDIIDELPFARIDAKFIRVLAQFMPFGPQNRSPVFYAKNMIKHGEIEAITSRHIKLRLACTETGLSFPAIIFHRLDVFRDLPSNQPFSIAFTLHDSSFVKGHAVLLQLKDFEVGGSLKG
jgi:single-stranded-DNA-specific exonuclease